MLMPGRHWNADKYRFGFQGMEKDDEIKGIGNSINYKNRMHDPRVVKFFAVDPLTAKYPYNSPYAFSENRVIDGVELEGQEVIQFMLSTNTPVGLSSPLLGVSDVFTINSRLPVSNISRIATRISTRISRTGTGTPRWNPRFNPVENLQRMSQLGQRANRIIQRSGEFMKKYAYRGQEIGRGSNLKPDGFVLDFNNRIGKIAEIKSATKTGIKNGYNQLNRYLDVARELYPEIDTWECELMLYRGIMYFAYDVQSGDNLTSIAKQFGVSIEELTTLNEFSDENMIYAGDKILIGGAVVDEESDPFAIPPLQNDNTRVVPPAFIQTLEGGEKAKPEYKRPQI